jgi:TPP-dependent indolepyruvate ferredoxin oxidoreductase alpha subunit
MNKGMAIGGAVMLALFGVATATAESYRQVVSIAGGYRVETVRPEVIAFLGLMTLIGIILMIVGLAVDQRRGLPSPSEAHYYERMTEMDKQGDHQPKPMAKRMPKFCSQCGESLDDHRARFCPNCGERMR